MSLCSVLGSGVGHRMCHRQSNQPVGPLIILHYHFMKCRLLNQNTNREVLFLLDLNDGS